MSEPWEVRPPVDRDEALRTTLVRAEHVWLLLTTGFTEEWVPGVLSEWRRDPDGSWRGQVSYAWRWWSETPNRPGGWKTTVSTLWAPADRIRVASSETAH